MQRRRVVTHGFLVADGNSPVVLHPTQESFDFISILAELSTEWLSGRYTDFEWQRRDRQLKSGLCPDSFRIGILVNPKL